jgi:hypothetical protein
MLVQEKEKGVVSVRSHCILRGISEDWLKEATPQIHRPRRELGKFLDRGRHLQVSRREHGSGQEAPRLVHRVAAVSPESTVRKNLFTV